MKKIYSLIFALLIALPGFSQRVLTLDECRQMALESNKTLEIAKENVEIATQLKKAAFTQFLPNFSANGSYMWNSKNLSLLEEDAHLPVGKIQDGKWVPIDKDGVPFNPSVNPEKLQYALLPKTELEFDIENVYTFGIGFTQPIYLGGKIRQLNKIAEAGQSLAKINTQSVTTDVIIEVDEAYWRVVSLEAKLTLAKQYLELLKKVNTDTKDLIEQGLATKSDELKVKVKLNEAELTMTRVENGLSLSRMALNQLIGQMLESEYTLVDVATMTTEQQQLRKISTEQAIDARPEIMALEQLEKIAHANTKVAYSRFLPNIALGGHYMSTNPNVYNGYANEFGGMFNVGVVVNVPLFHFGERIHTLKAAKGQARVVELQKEEAREKIELQLNQTSFRVAESIKKQQSTLNNIENAEENLRTANEGFKEGFISSTDLLGAQSAWLAAKSDNIDANIDVRLCILYLEKAQGGISIK